MSLRLFSSVQESNGCLLFCLLSFPDFFRELLHSQSIELMWNCHSQCTALPWPFSSSYPTTLTMVIIIGTAVGYFMNRTYQSPCLHLYPIYIIEFNVLSENLLFLLVLLSRAHKSLAEYRKLDCNGREGGWYTEERIKRGSECYLNA